jgi:Domain of unknown function (DUF4124)
MKRILVLACALAASTAAFGQLYKWVDKDGKVTYSDQPPPAQQSKQLNLNTGVASPPTRSAIDRDKEIEKGRVEAREKAKVASERDRPAELQGRARLPEDRGVGRSRFHDGRQGRAGHPGRRADRGRARKGAEGGRRGLQDIVTLHAG